MISNTLPTSPAAGLDLDLIRRHAIPGPRYTSYPAATQFTPTFDHAAAKEAIIADNRTTAAGPISLYIHLPWCVRKGGTVRPSPSSPFFSIHFVVLAIVASFCGWPVSHCLLSILILSHFRFLS